MCLPIVKDDTRQRVLREIESNEDWTREQRLAVERKNPLLAKLIDQIASTSNDSISVLTIALTMYRLLEAEQEKSMN